MKTQRQQCCYCRAVLEFDVDGSIDGGPLEIRCSACERTMPVGEGAIPVNSNPPPAVSVSVGECLILAIAILKRNLGRLLLISVLANLIWWIVVGVPAQVAWMHWQSFATGDIGDNLPPVVGWLAMAVFPVSGLLASSYTMLVMLRACLRFARRRDAARPSVVTALAVPIVPWLRLSALLAIVSLVVVGVLVVGVIGIVILSMFLDPQLATYVGTLAVGGFLFAVILLFQWLLWPVIVLIGDQRTDLATGLRWGVSLSWQHRRESLALVTVYFVLSTVGALIAYVGQVLTMPLALMPLVVGYSKMTGGDLVVSRPTSDESLELESQLSAET